MNYTNCLQQIMTAPEWMTTDFFQRCLQSQEDQPVTVTKFTIGPQVVPEGNNYGSQLFRVIVDYNKGSVKSLLSLIIKGPLKNIEDFFGDTIYERERKFYSEFIEATYKLCVHDLVPKHYNSPCCVVLEDLKTSGYIMVDRNNFLDLEHCKLYIKAKAKLHALSVAVHRKSPEMIDSLVKETTTFKENSDKMTKITIEGALRCMSAYLEDKPDYKEYLDVIKECNNNENMYKMYKEVDNFNSNKPFQALIQQDPWCTNMMFKYNSLGRVENIKLLDFQALALTSPFKELVTFLTLSSNMEVRKTNFNDLYNLYCDNLNDNLEELGCPERLNFEELKEDMVSMSPLVLYLICIMPFMLAEEPPDLSDYFSGKVLNVPIKESPMYKLYQGATFNRYYPQILDLVAKEGVFDVVKDKIKQMEYRNSSFI